MAIPSIQPITRLRRKLQQQPSFLLRRNPLFLQSPLQRPFAPTISPLHHNSYSEGSIIYSIFFFFKVSNSKGSRELREAVWSRFSESWGSIAVRTSPCFFPIEGFLRLKELQKWAVQGFPGQTVRWAVQGFPGRIVRWVVQGFPGRTVRSDLDFKTLIILVQRVMTNFNWWQFIIFKGHNHIYVYIYIYICLDF